MSLLPILWALKTAPVVDAEERAIMVTLAESAWSDGTDAFPSKKTIAEIAKIDPKTVQRRLKTLTARGLISKGNQNAAAYIPEHFRPQVYDLMIPYSWFPDIDQVNAERKAKGKRPLTPEERPDLAEAPSRKARADKGKPRKKPQSEEGTTSPQGEDSQSPGQTGQEGGTTSPGGGDYKSHTGGLQDPQPSPTNPPRNTPRPSVPDNLAADQDGGTDGREVPNQVRRNPGVDLLSSIGAEKPEFLLTGKTLQDQGLAVAGMLMEGWTPDQLRQVIAGRPLPDQIHTTVGAVVSSRLRQALTGPVPDTVRSAAHAPSMSVGVDTLPRPTVIPMQNCDRCDRGFRAPERGLCRSCREEVDA
ncbi:helix-turn-helix domain-containing protein [Streptomyces sp. NPDC046862]|uniref:helix-turn-helix domain-containing protein n=1 Tax=Streptomyces sp. NPDC046862 TaxID=3154603 RepID=UPI003454918C